MYQNFKSYILVIHNFVNYSLIKIGIKDIKCKRLAELQLDNNQSILGI